MIQCPSRARAIRAKLAPASLAFLWALLASSSAFAAPASSGAIAQGFQADSSQGAIAAGALVSTKTDSSNQVELATTNSATRLIGVVDSNPLVALSENNQEVQIVLSGSTNVLVSDINGPIKASDKITASPIAGIGMVATADSQVVGTAQANLDTRDSQTRTITDRSGKAHQVHIALVPLQVGVAYYRAPGSDFLPPFVQNLANNVAGRPVSLLRVVLSAVLLLFGTFGIGVLISSSVRSAMISLGRNPLAAVVIRRGLYQTAFVTLMVLGGTLLASYLVLVV